MDTDDSHATRPEVALSRIERSMAHARSMISQAMATATSIDGVAESVPSVKEQTTEMAERMYAAAQAARDIESGLAQLHASIRTRGTASTEG